MNSNPVHRLVSESLATAIVLFSSFPVAASLLFADGFEAADLAGLDERRVRSMVADAPPDAARVDWLLEAVGNNGGYPVATRAGTFLFVARCDAETWSLTGDFNAWTPASMTRHGAMCWTERAVAPALEQRYRFVRPNSSQLADPSARRYVYIDDAESSLVRSQQQRIERWFAFGPQVGLLPRTLRILVPANDTYDRVMYMHDGQELFDPQAAFGGWNLQASLPPGALIVGIDNTPARLDEYTHVADDLGGVVGGSGDTYAELVHVHIRPWIEQRYGSFVRQGLLGSSLGGLVSLHIADRYPGAYDFAGSMSGTLGWGRIGDLENDTMMTRYLASGYIGTAIYLDSGGGAGGACVDNDGDGVNDDGTNSDNYCVTLQMRDVLLGLGHVSGDDLLYLHDTAAPTNPAAWGARVSVPLEYFSGL